MLRQTDAVTRTTENVPQIIRSCAKKTIPTVPFGVILGVCGGAWTPFCPHFGALLMKSCSWGARREAQERSKSPLGRQGCHFGALGFHFGGRIGAKIDTKTFVMPGCFLSARLLTFTLIFGARGPFKTLIFYWQG